MVDGHELFAQVASSPGADHSESRRQCDLCEAMLEGYGMDGPVSFACFSGIWAALPCIPIGSMYGIYANIWGILMVNVTIYSIHGSYGI